MKIEKIFFSQTTSKKAKCGYCRKKLDNKKGYITLIGLAGSFYISRKRIALCKDCIYIIKKTFEQQTNLEERYTKLLKKNVIRKLKR